VSKQKPEVATEAEHFGLTAPPEPPKRTRRPEDPEIKAMREIDLILTDTAIPQDGIYRILQWMNSRYYPKAVNAVPLVRNTTPATGHVVVSPPTV
jgi:hypothetical protein